MSEYRHGAYADPEASRDYVSPPGIGTIPVYVGRAPVHQLADYAGRKDVPLLINSYNDAIQQIGYSDDWRITSFPRQFTPTSRTTSRA